jgi:hypothetical protein
VRLTDLPCKLTCVKKLTMEEEMGICHEGGQDSQRTAEPRTM